MQVLFLSMHVLLSNTNRWQFSSTRNCCCISCELSNPSASLLKQPTFGIFDGISTQLSIIPDKIFKQYWFEQWFETVLELKNKFGQSVRLSSGHTTDHCLQTQNENKDLFFYWIDFWCLKCMNCSFEQCIWQILWWWMILNHSYI